MAVVENVGFGDGKNLIAAAVYGRPGEGETEASLRMQLEMLQHFTEDHPDLELADSYADNGISETNYDRPEFVRLMEDVLKGRIGCIVVRDLSCFGPDYLETGYYIGTLFPRLNVRFIAVEDGFDSAREEDRRNVSAAIQKMVRDRTSRSLSISQCEAADRRAKRPDVMPNGSAPFGYRFSEDKKQYLVDPENAPYVRMIFQWMLMGVSIKKIAQRMNLLGVMTPGQNRRRTYGKEMASAKWRADVVYKILQNPNYTGDIATGRLKQALYKSEGRRRTSSEEWTVRRNAHEPLVTREDYQRVQEIIQGNRKTSARKK